MTTHTAWDGDGKSLFGLIKKLEDGGFKRERAEAKTPASPQSHNFTRFGREKERHQFPFPTFEIKLFPLLSEIDCHIAEILKQAFEFLTDDVLAAGKCDLRANLKVGQ